MSFRLSAGLSLLLVLFSTSVVTAQRRNFYGMHNLKDGGTSIPEGMNWTRHLVGEGGYVFDWVRGDYGRWVVDAMERDLIPCLRVQNCNGGCDPDPGHAEIVANVIRQHLEQYRPEFTNRLVYLQLWNEPGDPRDFVTPEDFADFLVAAHAGVKRADVDGVFRTMTPGQNGPEWWRTAIRHNPAVCQAFDVWATHPYPESYPPHYNHHDGIPYINQVKTIDSYLLDLDAVVSECEAQGSPRRGFPVMITETAYGDHLGIAYEGYPKTTRGGICSTDGPCDFGMASEYNVAAFSEFWHKWPEVIAVHPFILQNWSWDHFAFVSRGSQSRDDAAPPSWCPPQDIQAATPWPPNYNTGAQRCGLPNAPYPQYKAILDIPKPPPARLEPYSGAVGTLRGRVTRQDTGEPVRFATASTDGYEFGGPTMSDGIYVARDVAVGTYTLSVNKVGYRTESRVVTVQANQETVADFDLVYEGKVSKGIYFQNQGTCDGCNLFAPFLGQTLDVPDDIGFIKFAAAMPNVGQVTMKFSIHEDGPEGAQVGTSVTAFPEWGGEMIGAEWPGDGVAIEHGGTYFLRVERADGEGVYAYATDANPYPGGMAFTGTTPHPGWDLLATVRGNTVAVNSAVGTLTGIVQDESNVPLVGATVSAEPGGLAAASSSSGQYSLSVSEGTYNVTATLDGYLSQTSGVAIVQNQTTVLNFTLARDVSQGSIEGTVSDVGGNPLPNALVTVSGLQALTDLAGRFILEGLAPGAYTLTASADGYAASELSGVLVAGGEVTEVGLSLAALPAPSTLIANGDFSQGLQNWSTWVERGDLTPTVDSSSQLHLRAVGHNGGVYQQFATGGAGSEITIEGLWSSHPTFSNAQWGEVLIIDSARAPVNGQDLHADQPDVVLIYKNDTWSSPNGWSGTMSQSSSVAVGSFTASGDVATIVLKSGNLLGIDSGTFFDDLMVRGSSSPPLNTPPVASIAASPASGTAPLTVLFDGSGSHDNDGDAITYSWSFGGSGVTTSHTYDASGTYTATLTVDDGRGGSDSATATIDVTAATPTTNLVANGNFAQGLQGWSAWVERGNLSPTVSAGRLEMAAIGHNGGVYQQFSTGGVGSTISVGGLWGSNPTAPNAQWAEVLVIDGARSPVNGQDVSSAQPDVVMIYKNDTWTSPGGWSGGMARTSPVHPAGSFVAAGNVATIVLKSGNVLGVHSGTFFDDVVVTTSASGNAPPTAAASATPSSGSAPLPVSFDASASTDPDGDALSFAWEFGDGNDGTGASVSHTYGVSGSFTATVTVGDGRGGADSASVTVTVGSVDIPPTVTEWDPRLTSLGLQATDADVPPGTWYWKLVTAKFESDGEIFPPPGGGSESNGTHSVYVKALNPDGSGIEGQEAIVAWPNGNPTNEVSIHTKAAVDDFWGDFAMAGGWCPFYPDGPRGPYGARMAGAASDEVWGMGMPCNRHVSYRFTWKWTQKDSGQSKLSIHAGFGGPLSMQFVDRAKPRILKILDSFSAAPEVKRLSPGTEIIGRAFLANQPMDGDPVQRAREWWDRTKGLILQYPEIDYWEGYNEPIIHTPELMAWYAAFESERVRLLADNGRRACIANFSVGNPDLPLWPHFFPAFDAAKANGGILGLHEYGTPMQQHFDETVGEGWFTGRYRKLYRQYLIPNNKVIPLAITETGVDVVSPVGWKNHFTEEEYLDQLAWYDSVMLEDDYVLGATIFALEIPGWWSFDIAPIVDRLADYVAATP